MFTPFADDDQIDFSGLAREAQYLKAAGVSGMVVGGSMGEGAGMSPDELAEAVRTVIEAIGANSTSHIQRHADGTSCRGVTARAHCR